MPQDNVGWRHTSRADLTEPEKIRYLEDDVDRLEMHFARDAAEIENDLKDIKDKIELTNTRLNAMEKQQNVDRNSQKDRDNKILLMMLGVALTVVASVVSIIITLVVT